MNQCKRRIKKSENLLINRKNITMNQNVTIARSFLKRSILVIGILFSFSMIKATEKKTLIEIACNDLLHVSLDSNCFATITPNMVLEDMIGVNADYTIKVYLDGILESDLNFGSADINKTFDFKIWHLASGNSCWGKVKIEDKYPPLLVCSNDTIRCATSISPSNLGFPIPSWLSTTSVQTSTTPPIYVVTGWDKCSKVELTYTDNEIHYTCLNPYIRKIIRTWVAKDSLGNTSTCNDTICIIKPSLADIVYPKNYDGLIGVNSTNYLLCSSTFPKLPNGNPSPSHTGHPISNGCTTLNATFSDLKIVVCDGTYKILRRWVILDWCTQGVTEYNQTIKVVDDVPPLVECPVQFTVGMDTYSCTATTKIPPPASVEDCGKWTYDVYVKLREPATGQPAEPSKQYISYNITDKCFYLNGAPEGRIWIIYYVTDDCGNKSECATEVGVVDNLAPLAVCDQKTVITLAADGSAKAYASSFDAGSTDNCKIKNIKVARMLNTCGTGTAFGDFVEFCCLDIGTTVMVALQVEDTYGNKNTCMVEAIVQEKVAPIIVPPTDITISCEYKYSDLKEFGVIRTRESDRTSIIIRDNNFYSAPTYYAGRDGLATDNCSVTVDEIVERNINCNQGTITRIFTAKDNQGLTSFATQTITIRNTNFFDRKNIIFPPTKLINSCNNVITHPSNTGEPTYSNLGCAQVAANYEDLKLTFVDSVCYKILRKWTVVDWCQYNANTNSGIWSETQLIYVMNSEPPTIKNCDFVDFCDKESFKNASDGLCYGHYDLTVEGDDDCTNPSDLRWTYRLDINNDGIFESNTSSVGNRAIGTLPIDKTHRIHWTVQDQCGNYTSCDQLFFIRDCKKPTPYCINGIVTVVMPTTKTVQIFAKDFDVNSDDNCTSKSNLRISFSADPFNTSLILNCDSLKGASSRVIPLRIYVTDDSGNQDYCETFVRLQDNNNTCGGTLLSYSGNLQRANQSNIPNINIDLLNSLDQIKKSIVSNAEGNYAFNDIEKGIYKIVPAKNDDLLNGVSTFDILQIQKHILGSKTISDPYALIAADVNNSKSITARDISDLRKAILGVSSNFNNNKSWRFIPKAYSFADQSYPYDFPEFIETGDLESYDKNHFIGMKIGDIDMSASLFTNAINRNTNKASLILNEGSYDAIAQVKKIGISLNHNTSIEGLQMALSLNSNKAEFISFESGQLDINKENYNVLDKEIRLSVEGLNKVFNSNLPLFYILINADVNVNELTLKSSSLKSEIYFTNGEIKDIELKTEGKSKATFNLLTNQPNPFSQNTTIRFDASQEMEVSLRIYNTTGDQIYSQKVNSNIGINEIKIDRHQVKNSGIYFYELEADAVKMVQKMIVLD